MRSASASNSPGVTATSCTQATNPNVPTPPKRQPLLGQIYGLSPLPTQQPVTLSDFSGRPFPGGNITFSRTDPFTGQAVGGARVGAGSRPSSGASPSRNQIGTGDGFVASHCDRARRAGARMCGAIGRFPRSRVIAVHACSLLVALAGTTDTDTTELTLRG